MYLLQVIVGLECWCRLQAAAPVAHVAEGHIWGGDTFELLVARIPWVPFSLLRSMLVAMHVRG